MIEPKILPCINNQVAMKYVLLHIYVPNVTLVLVYTIIYRVSVML